MSGFSPSGPLIAIVGATGIGKTALALALADVLPVEVVSADSRQVYRFMDIGTAKPTEAERSRVRHHLVDVVYPDQPFTLAQYQEMAYDAINGILSAGKLPLLVGGTGLYVRAVLEGLAIPQVQPNRPLRAQLEGFAQTYGAEALHRRLKELDWVSANRIDPRNVRRVVRAIEVCQGLNEPMSSLQRRAIPPYRVLRLGMSMDRPQLYARIDDRVDRMVSMGLVAEVQGLANRGYDFGLPSMSGLGYRQIGMYFRGEVTLEEAVGLIKRHTRRFVRQQATWFRADDARIHWLEASRLPVEQTLQVIDQFVSGGATLP